MSENKRMKIRFAEETDIALILSFIKELAEYEKLSNEVIVDEVTLKETLFGDRPYAEVLIADLDNQPVGFALFFHNYSTFLGKPGLYLEDLYVRPEARGEGIGKQLLKRLAQIALERNCGRLEWWVLDWNDSAIEFYKKIGAKPMDEWTVYRVTDDKLVSLAEK